MRFVQINPRYRDQLGAMGLHAPEHFLALSAVIVSGHPDRNVARVTLGNGPSALAAFLKREHRVRWRDRLASFVMGFGFVTKSQREAQLLQALEQASVGCPEWIAFGEDSQGRAFLLIRALTDAVDLRRFLQEQRGLPIKERRCFARRLGAALARLHAAGFDHPDLYAKHVFVSADGETIRFIDWQRSRRGQTSDRQRCRDLAALHATLADDLASATERLACLQAYVMATWQGETPAERMDSVPSTQYSALSTEHPVPSTEYPVPSTQYSVLSTQYSVLAGPGSAETSSIRSKARQLLKRLAWAIHRQSQRLLQKRHIRAARPPSLAEPQELVWLDGEALCITPEFLAALNGAVPHWLRLERVAWRSADATCAVVALPRGRQGVLVRRRRDQLLRWLWSAFRGQPLMSPEVRQAGVLFCKQRCGLPAPRLLAFGQRRPLPWRTDSFLLTELAAPTGGSHEP
jgi:tRNA A-37 threonylcarbamoyl transferase component Bud32